MNKNDIIIKKLKEFKAKFYKDKLIKGLILFIGFGLIYFFLTIFVEYFLWLRPIERTFLFLSFLATELFLFIKYIINPILLWKKLKNGLNNAQAAKIIGDHFKEIEDKLTNYLQLTNQSTKSELLTKAIEQKTIELEKTQFSKAINFKANKKYLPILLFPAALLIVFISIANTSSINKTFDRIVHFKTQFQKPAPFQIKILNQKLQTPENKDFVLKVKVEGSKIPENIKIILANETYFMTNTKTGLFEYTIEKPQQSIKFSLKANDFIYPEKTLEVIKTPKILNIEIALNFPKYLNKKPEITKGTGNAIAPEGTEITWKIKTQETSQVEFLATKTISKFHKNKQNFEFSKTINDNLEYQIKTSNNKINNFEVLNYKISVIKDQFPTISVAPLPDSIKTEKKYLLGFVSDDYGISKIQIVYSEKNNQKKQTTAPIKINQNNSGFIFAFPENLPIKEATEYNFYFEVFDNDKPHGYKATKSQTFSSYIETQDEKQNTITKEQTKNIENIEKILKNQKTQFSTIDLLKQNQKTTTKTDYKDRKMMKDFIDSQQKQDQIMKEFADKIKENLDKFAPEDKKDPQKEELKNRIEKNKNLLDKNQKILEELKELNQKINSEDLSQKLDEIKQSSKNQTQTLQQLLELTKKYYVEKKSKQIAERLQKLAEKQDNSLQNKNTTEEQKQINDDFDAIKEESEEIKKENEKLKSPIKTPFDTQKQNEIKENLKEAIKKLEENKQEEAAPKQKNASKLMKEMAKKIEKTIEQSKAIQIQEDAKQLRQILDNLLDFSFSQEEIIKEIKAIEKDAPSLAKQIKKQQNQKILFKHIDDSLFAMSMRNPKIEEKITKEISDIQYNIDKSLQTLSESNIQKGISHQQYSMASANSLADDLSDILSNMQMSMSSQSQKSGNSTGMQLKDIIKKQQEIGEQLKSEPKKNPSGKPSEDEENAQQTLEIYKQQQQLRHSLEEELKKQGFELNGKTIMEQMKRLEKQLLNKGLSEDAKRTALQINQELLKLDTAIRTQKLDSERESSTGNQNQKGSQEGLAPQLREYINAIDPLNRKALPLSPEYKQKTEKYFNTK